jgi:hypothetical protein
MESNDPRDPGMFGGYGEGRMSESTGSVGDRIEEGRERLARGLDEMGVDDVRNDLASRIRQRPLLACGVALGIGFLLGSMGGDDDEDGDDDYELDYRRHRPDEDEDDDEDESDDRTSRFSTTMRRARNRWSSDSKPGRGGRDETEDEGSDLGSRLTRTAVSGAAALLSREVRRRVAGTR